MAQLTGIAAATLTALAFLPQVLKAWRTKSTSDLSMATLLTQTSGVALWVVYGASLRSMPMIVGNTVTLILMLLLLGFKLVYGNARADA